MYNKQFCVLGPTSFNSSLVFYYVVFENFQDPYHGASFFNRSFEDTSLTHLVLTCPQSSIDANVVCITRWSIQLPSFLWNIKSICSVAFRAWKSHCKSHLPTTLYLCHFVPSCTFNTVSHFDHIVRHLVSRSLPPQIRSPPSGFGDRNRIALEYPDTIYFLRALVTRSSTNHSSFPLA